MSRIISHKDAEACRCWEPPIMGGQGTGGVSMMTARRLEQIESQAREEGLALGRREAIEALRPRLEAVIQALAEPLAELDEAVIQQLALLVRAVARQLIRRELKSDPGEIVGLVREALGALPAASGRVVIHLHPEDAALVREALKVTGGEEGRWRLVEDPTQDRGGCRVLTEHSQIDASVERRLTTVINRMMGGEREQD